MENQSWKEKLEQVRSFGKTEQVQEQVKTKEQLDLDEIEAFLKKNLRKRQRSQKNSWSLSKRKNLDLKQNLEK